MSLHSLAARPLVQRLCLPGIGAAVLLVGIATPAAAATDVVIPLEPAEVALTAFPAENFGAMDPMADPEAPPVLTPVGVQYGGTITVAVPAELDDSTVGAELVFDDDGDGIPEATYSSSLPLGDPKHLAVSGQGTGSISVTLPADDPVAGDAATLLLEPFTSTLGPAFTFYDPVAYELGFEATASAAQTVAPVLVGFSQEPCELSSATRCPFPTPVTAGSTVGLDLTAGSALRELGLTDLTGVEVGLQQLDADGAPVGAAVVLTAQVTGSTATFVVPAGTAAGSYGLVVAQESPSGTVSIVVVEITVEAEVVAVVAAPTEEPTTVNAGLRSNTGVEVVESGPTGSVAVATGAGLLLLAGAGGVAVARTRRRPAAEGGQCGA